MAGKSDTDAKKLLEELRAANYADVVTAEMLHAVYAVEHEKQFEDDRAAVEVALRDLIVDAVKESS